MGLEWLGLLGGVGVIGWLLYKGSQSSGTTPTPSNGGGGGSDNMIDASYGGVQLSNQDVLSSILGP